MTDMLKRYRWPESGRVIGSGLRFLAGTTAPLFGGRAKLLLGTRQISEFLIAKKFSAGRLSLQVLPQEL